MIRSFITMKVLIILILIATITSPYFCTQSAGQARNALVTKLRRRSSQITNPRSLSRAHRISTRGNVNDINTNSGSTISDPDSSALKIYHTPSGITYASDRELTFRADFRRNPYLPGLPYWRMDGDMPGVTPASRFAGAYHGYYSDYYRGTI